MAILDFPDVCPKRGTTFETGTRTRKAQFGDGYHQSALDGINANTVEFSVTFTAQPDSDAQVLHQTLIDSVATDAFTYTPRSAATPIVVEVVAGSVVFAPVSATHAEVVARFRQVHI